MTTSEENSKKIINLAIAIPAYGFKILPAPAAEMYLSLGITLAASEERFSLQLFTYTDVCGIDIARNRMVQEAINNRCDWLLMIDADTWHPDGFDILRMISEADRTENCAIVVAPTPKRDPNDTHLMVYKHLEPGGCYKIEKMERRALAKFELANKLNEIDSAATAMMAINLKFLKEKFTPPWFKFVWEEGSSSTFLSEDLYFCQKVKELGGKIFADGRFICKHLQRPEVITYKDPTK